MLRIATRLLALLLLASATVYAQSAREAAASGARYRLPLDTGWTFREAGKGEWRRAAVPGSVHTDLLAAGLIEDPFYRDNEPKLQWVGRTDWEYRTGFDAPAWLLARRNVELVFEGLDTYAEVFVNDRRVLSADNMFRTWRVDVKAALKPGRNTLRVLFRSAVNEILPRMKSLGYELPAVNDQGEKTSPHTRKAPYHYGWDWGPRFVTSGVWRPAWLEAWDTARVAGVRVVQNQLGRDSAQMTAEVEVVSTVAADARVTVENVTDRTAGVRQTLKLAPGTNKAAVHFTIDKPRLWWPSGMGAQPLYDIRVSLHVAGRRGPDAFLPADTAAARTGLRTVELRQQADKAGKSFMFVVNGVPVFAKGANWIPADTFPARVTRERYRHLLESARDANMNMLRVWGGGYYEADDFYELCDELGLLVWQDFMFACSMYPGDEKFLESVRAEAADNVKRLRNHASVALWCGNNEVETAWHHWGWKQRLPAKLWDDYLKVFHGVLPEVVAEHDPARAYWPSSPSSNLEEDADSQRMGDVHYWEVWHASKPFSEYETQHPRFMSEYGFQSFPLIETVNAYTLPSDHDIQSPVMLAHQKHPRGNQLIREYMLREYPEPKDFESFLYVSQVLQAEGIKVGAEHLRRQMPHNMGSLYWQLNDCWPVASWSSIDYFGRWKALQYYARRFYSPLLVSPRANGGAVDFHVVSDRPEPVPARLVVTLFDFDGRALLTTGKDVTVSPLRGDPYMTVFAKDFLGGRDPKKVFLLSELKAGGRVVSANTHFFRPFKELSLDAPRVSADVAATRGGFKVRLTTDKLARAVHLSARGAEGSFNDNFIDLIPGRPVEVEFRAGGRARLEDFRKGLKVRSLADAFR
ncbi:MAG: glycoside hydrolase family 2 protein [Acidobacteria bacterium]|nr:glycoside hydrolase family 2 protein [Acidobacteriota bacterium]